MIGECSQNQFLSFLLEKFPNLCMNTMKRNSLMLQALCWKHVCRKINCFAPLKKGRNAAKSESLMPVLQSESICLMRLTSAEAPRTKRIQNPHVIHSIMDYIYILYTAKTLVTQKTNV